MLIPSYITALSSGHPLGQYARTLREKLITIPHYKSCSRITLSRIIPPLDKQPTSLICYVDTGTQSRLQRSSQQEARVQVMSDQHEIWHILSFRDHHYDTYDIGEKKIYASYGYVTSPPAPVLMALNK